MKHIKYLATPKKEIGMINSGTRARVSEDQVEVRPDREGLTVSEVLVGNRANGGLLPILILLQAVPELVPADLLLKISTHLTYLSNFSGLEGLEVPEPAELPKEVKISIMRWK